MHRRKMERSTFAYSSGHQSKKSNRARAVNRLAVIASASVAAALCGSVRAAVFTYNDNTNSTTDLWSLGTDWSPSAPASAATTELTFAPTGGTFADGITNTSTDDIAGNFSLNILDLTGTGPVTTASVVNINSSLSTNVLNFLSNGSTTPVVNLTATAGAGLTYNLNAPINFANNTNFTGSGTAIFNLSGKTTAAAGTTVQKTGTSTLTINPGSNADTFITLQANGGTLNLGGGTINTTNLQMSPASGTSAVMNLTGGTVTVSTDFRMQGQAAGTTAFNISGGSLNLSKVTLGSASQANAANNIITVSNSAAVNQNQTGSTRELWVGGNNAGSGTLLLKDSSSWTASTSTTAGQVLIGRFGGTGVFTIQDTATFTDTGSAIVVADTLGSASTTGTINLNGGTLAVTGVNQGAGNGTANISNATFNANGGTVKALAANTNFFNGFSNATTIKVGSFNLLANGLNFNTNTFADTIANTMTGVGGISKSGAGTLTLTSNNTYSGNTSISAGVLLVNGVQTVASGSPNINITGGTLGGIGTVVGTFNHTTGTVTGATVGTIGTLTLGGPVTLNGGTALFDVNGANVVGTGNNAGAGDLIQVNNNLAFGASPETINFAFTNTGSLPTAFTYKLFGYTGSLSGTPNLLYTSNLGRTQFTTNTATAGEVDVNVTPVSAALNWNSTTSGAWDVQTSSNWYNTGTNSADVFFNGDNVNFVDNNSHSTPANGQLQTTIAINSTVLPSAVTVSSNTNNYTFTGTGSIGGAATLAATGTSTLTVLNNNSFTGGTTINAGGTIQLGDGTVTTGTLGTGAVVDNGLLITNYGAGTTVFANAVSGTGALTNNGSGTLSVTGTSNYTGATTINAGTVQLDGTGSLTGNGNIVNNAAIVSTGTNTLGGNLTGAGTVTTTGTATLILTGNNSAFAGTTTVNTGTNLQIGNGGTTGTIPGGTLNINGTLTFNRSNTYNLSNPLTVTTGTVADVGTGTVVLTGNNSIGTLTIGKNVPAGTVIVPSGASLSVGNAGTGALNIASSPNDANSALSAGTLDASNASSFTANVATVSVGLAGNHAVAGNTDTASGNLYLPASSTITATTSFVVGDSGGARNGDTGTLPNNSSNLTIAGGGTTTVNTPIFTIGGTKSTASFTLGAGGTFNLAGIGTGGRTAMSVGNIVTGGGGGTYITSADLSAGAVNLTLSNLIVGVNSNNTGAGTAQITSTMHIGSSTANHLDITGQPSGPAGNAGVVNIGSQAAGTTTQQQGTLTIDFLDASSQITSTDNTGAMNNGTAILVGGAQSAGASMGTLNLNGGSLTFNTTGSAIASDTNAVAGFSTSGTSVVNFNGMKLIAGADSATWIQNLVLFDGVTSGANILAGGLPIDTNSHNIAIPQQFVSGGGTDGGLTKLGAGRLTLSSASGNNYTGNTTVNAGTLKLANTSGSGTGSGNIIMNGGTLANDPAGGSVSGNVLAGTGAHTIAPGDIGSIGSFTIGSLTSSNLTSLNFDLGTGIGVVTNGDLLTLSNASTIGSGTAITIGGTPVVGNDYRLINGSIGGINLANFSLPSLPGFTFSLSTSVDAGYIDLVVGQGSVAQNLTWNNTGAGAPTDGVTWDINNNINWNNGTSPSTYHDGDTVTFNDTNNAHYAVTLNTTVTPASVTVNNSTSNYSISGSGSIAGSGSLTKSGTAGLTISNVNTYTGDTNVNGGTLTVAPAGSIAGSVNVNVASGGTLAANGNTNAGLSTSTVLTDNGIATIAAATSGVSSVTVASVTLGTTGSLSMTNSGNHVNRKVLVTGALNFAGSANAWGGKLDLQSNDLIVHNGNLANITNQIKQGYAGGSFTGTAGITNTSPAADTLHTLGSASGLVGTYDGVSVIGTDVFVKYTYYGDADLNGVVNGNDYSQIDFAFTHPNTLSGWQNGDFNYDNKIDGSDYSLIDNAFNRQSGSLAASSASMVAASASEVASPSAVPEPTSLGLFGICAVSLLGRRRRKAK